MQFVYEVYVYSWNIYSMVAICEQMWEKVIFFSMTLHWKSGKQPAAVFGR